jgi:hypothetical protein
MKQKLLDIMTDMGEQHDNKFDWMSISANNARIRINEDYTN